MFQTIFEPIFFRLETVEQALRLSVARDDDFLRLRFAKKPGKIVCASDLVTIARISMVVPEMP